ncbi:MAG: hypothetical protein EOO41_01030, partial [Methanobacteriota archaeon]
MEGCDAGACHDSAPCEAALHLQTEGARAHRAAPEERNTPPALVAHAPSDFSLDAERTFAEAASVGLPMDLDDDATGGHASAAAAVDATALAAQVAAVLVFPREPGTASMYAREQSPQHQQQQQQTSASTSAAADSMLDSSVTSVAVSEVSSFAATSSAQLKLAHLQHRAHCRQLARQLQRIAWQQWLRAVEEAGVGGARASLSDQERASTAASAHGWAPVHSMTHVTRDTTGSLAAPESARFHAVRDYTQEGTSSCSTASTLNTSADDAVHSEIECVRSSASTATLSSTSKRSSTSSVSTTTSSSSSASSSSTTASSSCTRHSSASCTSSSSSSGTGSSSPSSCSSSSSGLSSPSENALHDERRVSIQYSRTTGDREMLSVNSNDGELTEQLSIQAQQTAGNAEACSAASDMTPIVEADAVADAVSAVAKTNQSTVSESTAVSVDTHIGERRSQTATSALPPPRLPPPRLAGATRGTATPSSAPQNKPVAACASPFEIQLTNTVRFAPTVDVQAAAPLPLLGITTTSVSALVKANKPSWLVRNSARLEAAAAKYTSMARLTAAPDGVSVCSLSALHADTIRTTASSLARFSTGTGSRSSVTSRDVGGASDGMRSVGHSGGRATSMSGGRRGSLGSGSITGSTVYGAGSRQQTSVTIGGGAATRRGSAAALLPAPLMLSR